MFVIAQWLSMKTPIIAAFPSLARACDSDAAAGNNAGTQLTDKAFQTTFR
jgi:hypothetical protein